MRSEAQIKKLILDFAKQDDRIRAVLLNGSRANPNSKPDKFQDFDIVFLVDDLESFTSDNSWINIFGKQIINQLPDLMTFDDNVSHKKKESFAYLMLFEDGNRIDLTLILKQKFKTDGKPESQTILWLDKDDLFTNLPAPSDKDHHIQKPTEKDFLDTCNEFWWVSTYVCKGLMRNEITYAKEMLETVVRPMFMKILKWKVGIENDFSVSFGKSGKNLNKYLPVEFYNKVLQTYSNSDIKENWKSLLLMAEIFQETSIFVAENLGFNLNKKEQQNTLAYLKAQYER